MTALALRAMLSAGYLAGRAHGRSRLHCHLAHSLWRMDDLRSARDPLKRKVDTPLYTEREICDAFRYEPRNASGRGVKPPEQIKHLLTTTPTQDEEN